ncbi:MAG: glycine--tRNA ligase [Chloroflexi bacterium]|nr:glycine--tRNA ligase [Chloroflexota bacterium]
MTETTVVDLETLVALCKRRGFIFPSSEIYGGIGGFWDYGPLGAELKRNIRDAWWRACVQRRNDIVGLDASIIMHRDVWVASGHVAEFTDPMVDCRRCKRRFRADDVAGPRCPECGGELTDARRFNLMFKTFVGPVEDDAALTYLRPETAQGIFVNFRAVQQAMRLRLPFGIAQMGKAFRNEITPGKYLFRSREFEQMEIEYFVKPGTDEEMHRRWVDERLSWYVSLGMRRESLRLYEYPPHELAHYSKATVDIQFRFSFGWAEDLRYYDDETNEHYLPYVIEPSAGVDRSFLAFLIDAYREEPDKDETRVLLRLHPALAPVKVAVLPLSKKPALTALAHEVHALVRQSWPSMYDETQSIGRRYRRQDEIGTPFCVTIDFQSLEDRAVTIRDRDTMAQVRVPIAELCPALADRLRY